MNKQKEAPNNRTQQTTKKTPLDSFQLFYEELPLEVNKGVDTPKATKKGRLTRHSRSRS